MSSTKSRSFLVQPIPVELWVRLSAVFGVFYVATRPADEPLTGIMGGLFAWVLIAGVAAAVTTGLWHGLRFIVQVTETPRG